MGNIIEEKSFQFAVRIVKLAKYLRQKHGEFVMSKQLLRCGTSIGANVAESQRAQSTADFQAKLSVAHKECYETRYWLRLLQSTEYLTDHQADSMLQDCIEIEKILTSILNSSKHK